MSAPLVIGAAAIAGLVLARRAIGAPRAGSERASFAAPRYPPGSPEAIALFKSAARYAGFPEGWGADPGLHRILAGESDGWVGIPNYTYAERWPGIDQPSARAQWPGVWARLKEGRIDARSSATGLGQLLSSNAERYYPSGKNGIGNAFEEAVGMLRYIAARYGDPSTAWRFKAQPECSAAYLANHRVGYNRDAVVRHGCSPGEGY